MHRPPRAAARYARRHDASTDEGRIFLGLRRMIEQRAALPALAGGELVGFRTHNASVLGFTRPAPEGGILVLANFSEHPQAIAAEVFSASPARALERIGGQWRELQGGLVLAPCELAWLDLAARE